MTPAAITKSALRAITDGALLLDARRIMVPLHILLSASSRASRARRSTGTGGDHGNCGYPGTILSTPRLPRAYRARTSGRGRRSRWPWLLEQNSTRGSRLSMPDSHAEEEPFEGFGTRCDQIVANVERQREA